MPLGKIFAKITFMKTSFFSPILLGNPHTYLQLSDFNKWELIYLPCACILKCANTRGSSGEREEELEFCLFGILPLWKRSTSSLSCRSDRLCPSNGEFCVAPRQHLFKTDMATSHPRTSWPAWILLCWPLALESLFLSCKGLIPDVCPMALRAGHCKASVSRVAPGSMSSTAAGCHAGRGHRPHLAASWDFTHWPAPDNAPTVRRCFILSGICSASKFQAGFLVLPLSRSTALQTIPCCSNTSASGWLLKAGKHATGRREDTFWDPRKHFVQVKCRV